MTAVTAVTVTYGRRAALLMQVLDAAKQEGAAAAVVVNNGSVDPVAGLLAARYGDWAFVHEMGGNEGSAPGFRAGIETALRRGAEFLILLDDDNVLQPGALATLAAAFARRSPEIGRDRLALSAWRIGRQAWIQPGTTHWRPLRSSSFSFRVQKIPAKLVSLFRPQSPAPDLTGVEIEAPFAVYGGLFFHRSMIDFAGLPRVEFYVYGDDTDFTYRFTRAGGRILLISDAKIKDVALSWNEEHAGAAGPLIWVRAQPRAALFYQFRNQVYFDFHVNEKAAPMLWLNAAVYLACIAGACVVMRRWQSLRLFGLALADGIAGRLGRRPGFQL